MNSINDFVAKNGLDLFPSQTVTAFDTAAAVIIKASIGIPPSPGIPIASFNAAAAIAAAPISPPALALVFWNALALDINSFIITPLIAGSATLLSPAATGTPAPPIAANATSLASLPQQPLKPVLVKTLLEWAISFVLPGDPRVPGGFVIN